MKASFKWVSVTTALDQSYEEEGLSFGQSYKRIYLKHIPETRLKNLSASKTTEKLTILESTRCAGTF